MLRPFLLALLALLCLPSASFAATASSSLKVSLTVTESCRIERREHEPAPPQVSCAFASPYRVQPDDGKHASPSKTSLTPAEWEVVF